LVAGLEPRQFARHITAVLNQRLIRKLCNGCKEPFLPPPTLLEAFDLPVGKDVRLYQPPKRAESACPQCGGLGYSGRTGLFELLLVDDDTRTALAQQPSLESIRKAARGAGMASMERHGARLVAAGTTSPTELVRVLKLASSAPSAAPEVHPSS
jgi:type II secretory ATPase GspE/PulE/Tfp pilus assembly ATPase PilB-like protein